MKDPKLLFNKVNNRLNKFLTDKNYKDKIDADKGFKKIGNFEKIKIQTAEDNFNIIDPEDTETFKLQHDKKFIKKFIDSKNLLYKPKKLRALVPEFYPPK